MPQFDDLYGARLDLELNNNDSNTLFTSTRRQQGVNDGVREFAALTECYIRRASLAVSCNTAEYGLSTIADYTRLAADGLPEYQHRSSAGYLTQLAGEDFPRRDELFRNRYTPGWRASTTPVQTPSGYYLRRDGGRQVIGLAEPPRVGSSESVTLVVPYVAKPQPMAASTAIPFTDTSGNTRSDLEEYHQAAAVHYAAYKLLPLIGDKDGATDQMNQFLGYVARYHQNTRPKGGTYMTASRAYLRDAQRQAGRVAPGWTWQRGG
jgi:hypothetical protein